MEVSSGDSSTSTDTSMGVSGVESSTSTDSWTGRDFSSMLARFLDENHARQSSLLSAGPVVAASGVDSSGAEVAAVVRDVDVDVVVPVAVVVVVCSVAVDVVVPVAVVVVAAAVTGEAPAEAVRSVTCSAADWLGRTTKQLLCIKTVRGNLTEVYMILSHLYKNCYR